MLKTPFFPGDLNEKVISA